MTQSIAKRQSGFNLIELMIVIALVALLSAFAIPAYSGYMEDARVSQAVGDMGRIVLEIEKFRTNNNGLLPDSLDDLANLESKKDPWGKNYLYVNIEDDPEAKGRRKAGLGTLNRDYDLLSRGKDGKSSRNIARTNALDDILRANNGAYMGLAEDY